MSNNTKVMFDTKYTRNTKDTKYDFDNAIYAKDKDTFHLVIDDFGHQKLEKNGTDNWYAKIQSYHDGCALKCMLARYKETGDISFLSKSNGQYFDATNMPTSLLDMYKKVNEGKELFANLPLEVRQQFNNDFGEFLAKGGVYDVPSNSNTNVSDNTSNSNEVVKKESKEDDK